jgi:hypothetical protein|tara:strand:- start:1640 stop:2035 length:396 start_codon:yes stop_codon:yes gene_type:complete
MINYRNNNNRRNKFRTSNRNFRTNGSNIPSLGLKNNFQRMHSSGNNNNAPKLIEKYSNLAREALLNGDKMLSENYYQHADHFLRILQEQRMSKIESKKESNELITKKISANNVPGSNNKRTEPEAKLPKDI